MYKNYDDDGLFLKMIQIETDINELKKALDLVKSSLLGYLSVQSSLRHKEKALVEIRAEMKKRGLDPKKKFEEINKNN